MKKICHMTTAHPAKDIRIFYKECITLSTEGYKVFLIAYSDEESIEDISILRAGHPYNNRLSRMIFAGYNVYRKALELDADVYHFHDPELLPYGIRLKKKGKHVIYDSHEDVPRQILAKTWIPAPMQKLVSICYERYEKYVSRRLDYVIAATDHIKNIFIKNGCKAEAVKNYPLLDDIQCNNCDYQNRKPIICYAGGITEQRGISNILKAIENSCVEFHMAGNIESHYQKQLETMKGWKQVNYLGYLDRKDINDLYNKSRIGMVVLRNTPNHRYSLPIKMFEYMAAGIPVVASNFPLWEKIIDEVQCGICVDPEDVFSIRSAIHELLINETEAKIMGENGRKAVCSTYSWYNEAKKLVSIYKQICIGEK